MYKSVLSEVTKEGLQHWRKSLQLYHSLLSIQCKAKCGKDAGVFNLDTGKPI